MKAAECGGLSQGQGFEMSGSRCRRDGFVVHVPGDQEEAFWTALRQRELADFLYQRNECRENRRGVLRKEKSGEERGVVT